MCRTHRLAASACAVALLVGCGGSDDGDGETVDAEPTEAESPNDDDGETSSVDEPDEASDPDEPAPTTTVEAEPEPEPPPTTAEPVRIDLVELPSLVAAAVDATDPVATSRLVLGTPIAIPVDGATEIVWLDARVRRDVGDDGSAVFVHELDLSVGMPIGDVDISLDDNGPGSVEIIDLYDPIMEELGYRRANSTGSDPGDPGGPNSVNHVYVPEGVSFVAAGVDASPGNVLIWHDENLLGISNPTDDELVPGRRVDVSFETPVPDAEGTLGTGVASPVIASIAEAISMPAGTTFVDGALALRRRPPDSFDIDRGAHYLDVDVTFAAPPEATYDELVAWFADETHLGPDDGDVIGAEPSFFEAGSWEPTTGSEFSELDWRRGVLLAERYEGEVRVQETDAGVQVVTRFTLDAMAPRLTAPAE